MPATLVQIMNEPKLEYVHKQTISHLKALNSFMGSIPQFFPTKDYTDIENHIVTPLFVTVTTSLQN